MDQLASKNLAQFSNRLRTLAAACDFHEAGGEIKSQIIAGCISQKLRRKGLTEPSWNLQKLIEMGKVCELADTQASDIEKTTEKISAINMKQTSKSTYYNNSRPASGYSRSGPTPDNQRGMSRNLKWHACIGMHDALKVFY